MVYSNEANPEDETTHKMRFTLPKSARLHHQSLIDRLFLQRNNLYDYPLRLSWRALSDQELADNFRSYVPQGIGPVQIMVSVPKKKRRHAVDRVRLRRLVREAFRLQCHPLKKMVENSPDIRTLSIAFIYLDKDDSDFHTIYSKIGKLLVRLEKRLAEARQQEDSDSPTIPNFQERALN